MLTRHYTYIAPLLLAANLALGCGDDSPSTGGSGAGPATGGGGQGGAAATGGQAATGGSGGTAPLHPGPGETCDALLQDCADPAAPKCTLDFSDKVHVPSTCGPALGAAGPGESCTRPNDVPGEDTCAAGLFCSLVGIPSGEPAVCYPLCDSNDACGAGSFCHLLNGQVGNPELPPGTRRIGHCVPACDDRYDVTSCGPGLKCDFTNDIDNAWAYSCYITGGTPAGGSCNSQAACAPGTGCDPFVCKQFCDLSHGCPMGQACTSNVDGYCEAVQWACDPAAFDDGTTCNCGCGANDPDCANPALPVVGCAAGEACSDDLCVAPGWACAGRFYGAADGCDCGCGVVDPDCGSAAAAACMWCNDAGSCETSAWSCSHINPNDNSQCQ